MLNIKNKSHSVTADVTVPKSGANGVIITQGGSVGGWTSVRHEGKLKYCYNFFGIEYYMVEASKKIPAGKHQVRMEFHYDGGGLGRDDTGGTGLRHCDVRGHRMRFVLDVEHAVLGKPHTTEQQLAVAADQLRSTCDLGVEPFE